MPRARRRSTAARTTSRPAAGWRRGLSFVPVALAAAALAGLAAWALWPAPPRAPARPDVVLVTFDTLRADHVGCYGNAAASTPTFDRIAARGTRFANAVAHVPLTLPSHASILTGTTPLVHGVRDNAGFALGATPPTLAERFAASGYRTAAFVSGYTLHHRFGVARGFEHYDDRFERGRGSGRLDFIERRAASTVDAALDWLNGLKVPDDRPVFVWVHLFDPHAPYDPPEPFASRFRERPYDGEIACADAEAGRLIDALERRRSRGAPLVALTSDHGEGLGEHGEPTHGLFVYESTIAVPLVVSGPGIGAGRVVRSLARLVDVAPTLLDAAGLPAIEGTDGRSLVADGAGESGGPGEPAYVESLFGRLSSGWAPVHAWRERDRVFIDLPTPELYDLAADPRQLRNLAPDRPGDVARLTRMLRAAVSKGRPAAPSRVPRESAEMLRSIGYFGSGGGSRASLRDPKEMAATAVRIERAMTRVWSDPPSAIDDLRAVLAEDPPNALARRHLAMALAGARRYREAAAEIEGLAARGDADAESLTLLADCLRLDGRPAEAIEAALEAERRDPSMAEAPSAAARALVALGRRDQARTAFERALAASPGDPGALAGLGDLAIERGDLAQARLRLEALVERDPGDAAAALKLGTVLVRLGDLDRAVARLARAAATWPGDGQAHLLLAGALAKAGRPAEAVGSFERAIEAGVRTPVAWNGLAMARLAAGDVTGAIVAIDASLSVRPDQPDIVALRAKVRGR